MANWVRSFLADHPEYVALPVFKRDGHALHFVREDGQIEAHFLGKKIHEQDPDTGEWFEVDTALVDVGSGRLGARGVYDIQIVEQDWSAQDPITYSNRAAFFTNCLAASSSVLWRNTADITPGTQYSSNSLTNAWINKAGKTYCSMRSSNDYAGTPAPTSDEYNILYGPSNATTDYRLVLTVLYSAGGTAHALDGSADGAATSKAHMREVQA